MYRNFIFFKTAHRNFPKLNLTYLHVLFCPISSQNPQNSIIYSNIREFTNIEE